MHNFGQEKNENTLQIERVYRLWLRSESNNKLSLRYAQVSHEPSEPHQAEGRAGALYCRCRCFFIDVHVL